MTVASLRWNKGQADLHSLGAMLAPIEFLLSDGRWVSPMHVAPWSNEALSDEIPPVLEGLRGEWPCVPFGLEPEGALSKRWSIDQIHPTEYAHGYCSNNHWVLKSDTPDQISATITYPDDSAVETVFRKVSAVSNSSKLDIDLSINSRRNTKLPIGLHPVFRLPEQVGAMRLVPGPYREVWTYPGDLGAPSRLIGDSQYTDLRFLSGYNAEIIDATRLPFNGISEDLIMLTDVDGVFKLENIAERYRIILKWNAEHFPSVLIWISNFGRQSSPWNGRHLAVGIEPVCSAFDLGVAVSNSPNPVALSGIPTSIPLTAGKTWRTAYSIEVEPI